MALLMPARILTEALAKEKPTVVKMTLFLDSADRPKTLAAPWRPGRIEF
jgi:hypothetical protein